ncbi:MAG: hypothetical protein Q8P18_31170 [Pseudomonadota bacterium]|nr:hypothetical protein [Pseudomonadota bacterium]
MEFAQFHSFEPRTVESVTADLRRVIDPGHLRRRADLGVVVVGPWRPADLWVDGLERLVWTVGLESRGGPILSDAGEASLGSAGLARRQAPIHPIEALAVRAGDGLVMLHSDAARLAYVAVYRQRRLSWSLMLQDRVRLVRCDGQVVQVAAPPRFVPEGDRAGVLLAGLHQWLREPITVDDRERLMLADTLGQLTREVEPTWIVHDGVWGEPPAEPGVARASG